MISKDKYFRVPIVVCDKPYDYTAAFTMRLLNFLYKLNMKAQRTIPVTAVSYYAKRMTPTDTTKL